MEDHTVHVHLFQTSNMKRQTDIKSAGTKYLSFLLRTKLVPYQLFVSVNIMHRVGTMSTIIVLFPKYGHLTSALYMYTSQICVLLDEVSFENSKREHKDITRVVFK